MEDSIYEWYECYFDKWQMWKINNIIIEMSNISDNEIIKIEDYEGYIHQYTVPRSNGMKWVYDNILNKIDADKRPEVWVHDIKTRVLKYRIE